MINTQYICDKCGQLADQAKMITLRLQLFRGAHDQSGLISQYSGDSQLKHYCYPCCESMGIDVSGGWPSLVGDEEEEKVTLETIIRTMVAEEVAEAMG